MFVSVMLLSVLMSCDRNDMLLRLLSVGCLNMLVVMLLSVLYILCSG